MQKQITFTERASDFIDEAYGIVRNKIEDERVEKELNYTKCVIEILKDDSATMWVKWGKYDCKFVDLPARAMATITDNL